MCKYEVIRIRDKQEWKNAAAQWFHHKWGVPLEAYQDSIADSLKDGISVPTWYLCLHDGKIIGGAGVIENDFHNRKDLVPNVCALYTEEKYRSQGIAGSLLKFICEDMKKKGIDTLYLITDITGFYERYGWKFMCMVQGDGDLKMTKMYVHRE